MTEFSFKKPWDVAKALQSSETVEELDSCWQAAVDWINTMPTDDPRILEVRRYGEIYVKLKWAKENRLG